MIDIIQSAGVFSSEKIEFFDHKEIVPHNMFAVLAKARYFNNSFLSYFILHHLVNHGTKLSMNTGFMYKKDTAWIDILIIDKHVAHVIVEKYNIRFCSCFK